MLIKKQCLRQPGTFLRGGLGRRPILIMSKKSVQKKQEFETLSLKNEGLGPCKEGWGAAPLKCQNKTYY